MDAPERGDLHLAYVALLDHWTVARGVWLDEVALDFEQRFWDDVASATRSLEASAESFADVLAQALRRAESEA